MYILLTKEYTVCFKNIDIIWDVQGISEKKLISFCNPITWPIFIQMTSNFNSMCRNNLKFYV